MVCAPAPDFKRAGASKRRQLWAEATRDSMGLANVDSPASLPLCIFVSVVLSGGLRETQGGCQLAYGQLQVIQTRCSSIWCSMAGSLDKRELQFVALPAYQVHLLSCPCSACNLCIVHWVLCILLIFHIGKVRASQDKEVYHVRCWV